MYGVGLLALLHVDKHLALVRVNHMSRAKPRHHACGRRPVCLKLGAEHVDCITTVYHQLDCMWGAAAGRYGGVPSRAKRHSLCLF